MQLEKILLNKLQPDRALDQHSMLMLKNNKVFRLLTGAWAAAALNL